MELHQQLVQSLMQRYNFEVKGVPTILVLKPKLLKSGRMSKTAVAYNGARTAPALYKEALQQMPDYSEYVTTASLERFRNKSLPQALLISSKPKTPPMWKALSSKYRGRLALGMAGAGSRTLNKQLNVTGLPSS